MIENGEVALSSDMVDKLGALFFVELYSFQEEDLKMKPLSFKHCPNELHQEDLEVMGAVNRIALNSSFMTKLLKAIV